jgi:transcriptional regulator with XRE-family HTH domain
MSKLPAIRKDNLKELREARGWTQKELSRRSGLSQSTICRLEVGLGTNIRANIQKKLSAALEMNWLPTLRTEKKNEIATVDVEERIQSLTIQKETSQALTSLADSVKSIVEFARGGGLTEILQGQAKAGMVEKILGGLAAHDGRGALDARVLAQNALEISSQVEAVFDKFKERAEAKAKGEVRDMEIKDSEAAFVIWNKKNVS